MSSRSRSTSGAASESRTRSAGISQFRKPADHCDARQLFEAGTGIEPPRGDVFRQHEQRHRAGARSAQPAGDRLEQTRAEPAPAAPRPDEQLGEECVWPGEFEIEPEGADRVAVEPALIGALRDDDDSQPGRAEQTAQSSDHPRATKRDSFHAVEVRHQEQQLFEVSEPGAAKLHVCKRMHFVRLRPTSRAVTLESAGYGETVSAMSKTPAVMALVPPPVLLSTAENVPEACSPFAAPSAVMLTVQL